jgi:nucleotide-binding universal stress UspA family protein
MTEQAAGAEVPSGVVLAGVDGSSHALAAVRWAADEAQSRRVPLLILHAADYLDPDPRDRGHRHAQAILARGRAEAGTRATVRTTTVLATETPIPALVRASARASLIVLGATGSGGLEEILLGSTTLAVSGQSHCPVAAVRHWPLSSDDDRDIVLGVSAVHEDAAAVEMAFDLARRRGKPLTVVHCSLPRLTAPPTESFEAQREALADELAVWFQRYPEVRVRYRFFRTSPADALLKLAPHAVTVVAGCRRRGSAARVLLGSTSRALLRHSPTPVLVTGPGSGGPPSGPGWQQQDAQDPHELSQLW